MGLRTKYTVSMAITRLGTVGYKSTYASLGTVVGHLQPLDSAYAALIEGNLSKSYMVWVDSAANIDTGDKAVIASGDYAGTYYVKEVKKYLQASKTMKHKEIVIEQKDA